MDTYTEFIKQLNYKLKLKFEGSKDTLYSNWEINGISTQLSELYYKNELLQNISALLESGIKAKNIWIMNSSVKIENKYTRYKDGILSLEHGNSLELFYYLGSPVPLAYNRNTLFLFEVFEALRNVYTICNAHQLKKLNKKSIINELYSLIQEDNLKEVSNYFLNLIDKENSSFADLKNITKAKNRIKQVLRSTDENIQNIHTSEIAEGEGFSKKTEKFDKFEYIFKKYEKPIVVVLNNQIANEDNFLQILCFDFFSNKNFKKENPRFLETNEISQNSPLVMCLAFSITFLPSLIGILKLRIEIARKRKQALEDKKSEQNEINEITDEITRLDAQITSLETLDKKREQQYQNFIASDNNTTHQLDRKSINAANKVKRITEEMHNKGNDILENNKLKLESYDKKDIF
ncbi:hypothetical protein ACFO26_06840 [Lactococcus nasutitermitis]|uniref:Uncharacterized protein n=1 Tax=Lactococcus nasutitermitis TaxID=1652957 RepID=A0ABV9JDL8_9LACT|nr:hypothetical protein [Lactococcus nasutitermitis]